MKKTLAALLLLVTCPLAAMASDPVIEQKLTEIAEIRSTFEVTIEPNLDLMTKMDVYRILEVKNKKSELKALRNELCNQSQETVHQIGIFIASFESLSGNSLRSAGYPEKAQLISEFKLNATKMLKHIAEMNYEFMKEACFNERPDSGKLSILSFEISGIGFAVQMYLLAHQIESNIP